ncbi:MAG: sugar ABC transporter ATP-binding protein [Ruminococcus sp.]|jgi:ribose transport system ATP-binding protein|nr:sugar ABC transporter ATP-binding protein [Ruminococcus sp.]
MSEAILELKNITKRFPGVVALNEVSLDVRAGEIHALCGENGAGKSTLIKTCTGAVIPDMGEIVVEGRSYTSMTPQLADKCGIAVIYQELNSVGDLCAAENVFLGNEIRKGIVVDKKVMAEKAAKVFESLNIKIDPYEMVKDLTVGYRQMIEIAKAMVHNAKILIMDEPSAPLTNNETETLFTLVEDLRKKGVGIVYISHRMPEIFRLSDRITVMRDGQKIQTMDAGNTNNDELIKLMVGRELTSTFPERKNMIEDNILLDVQNITGNGVKDISFQLKKGEILGLAGLVGAGRTELAELIFGVKKAESGKIIWKGQEVHFNCPKQAIRAGIILCPEDRKQQGVCLPLSIWDNAIMASLEGISKGPVVNHKKAEEICQHYKEKLQIKTPSLDQAVKNLSGGNQQKVVLAKGLATSPELVIFDEPTRGIDVGAKYEIYKLLNALIEEGKTIIMISSEMEELMGMADRIIVLAEGEHQGELNREEFSQEQIMQYASGPN